MPRSLRSSAPEPGSMSNIRIGRQPCCPDNKRTLPSQEPCPGEIDRILDRIVEVYPQLTKPKNDVIYFIRMMLLYLRRLSLVVLICQSNLISRASAGLGR